jgi:hypothetical protein
MRLSEHEKETLKHAALACFGQGTRLRLFVRAPTNTAKAVILTC